MPLDNLHIHIDGGSRGNPGPSAAGVVFRDADKDLTLYEAGHWIGRATNNFAEYTALLTAVKLALPLKPRQTLIHSDSELMVKQINGEYRVKSADLKPLHAQALALLRQLGSWKIKHVYREKNARADELANKSMDAGRTIIDSPLVNLDAPNAAAPTTANTEKNTPIPALFEPAENARAAAPKNTAPPSAPSGPPGPRYSITFTRAPGAGCPAGCPAGKQYLFAKTTPVGLCIHAAAAVLSEVTAAEDPHDLPNSIRCARCDVALDLEIN